MAEPSRPLYRIKDFAATFELAASRRLNRRPWVPVPTRLDGRAYRLLVRDAPGVTAYGVFVALVLAAARIGHDGRLVRDDGETPLGVEDLSALTGIAEGVVHDAVNRLSDARIGWILHDGDMMETGAQPDGALEERRGEEIRGEEKTTLVGTPPATDDSDEQAPKSRRNPLTRRKGLVGDFARLWSREHGEREPPWDKTDIINFQRTLRAYRNGKPNEPPRCVLRLAFREYLADPTDHPSHAGKPLTTFRKRLGAYVEGFNWEPHDSCGPECERD